MNRYIQLAILIVLAAAALFLIPHKPQAPVTNTNQQQQSDQDEEEFTPEVVVDQPKYGDLVTSPMTVSGKAKGFWFFEANIPVELKDANGKSLVKQGLHAGGDWMTSDYVPFSGTLTFPQPETEFGVLIIEKDNPSGDPANDSSFAVPVKFK